MMSSFSMPWMRSRVVGRGRHRDCEALCIDVVRGLESSSPLVTGLFGGAVLSMSSVQCDSGPRVWGSGERARCVEQKQQQFSTVELS